MGKIVIQLNLKIIKKLLITYLQATNLVVFSTCAEYWDGKIANLFNKDVIQVRGIIMNENVIGNTSEKVYNFIMKKIVSKEWKPKERIMSENQLAEELNVSRVSVREALEKLCAFGILGKKQGFGTVVNEIKPSLLLNDLIPVITLSPKDLEDILNFRIYFEPGNVEMFMKNYDPETVKTLREHYNNMKENYHNPELYVLHDFYFHNTIAMGSKNPIVISLSEILHSILEFNIERLYFDIGPDVALYYHRVILEAIEKKDVVLASLMMKRHLEESLSKLISSKEKEKK